MTVPLRPAGGGQPDALGLLVDGAPNWRRISRWKSMGRSPIRHPPRSGMKASPRRCRSGPQNRIGIREDPACASMSAMWRGLDLGGVQLKDALALVVVDAHAVQAQQP